MFAHDYEERLAVEQSRVEAVVISVDNDASLVWKALGHQAFINQLLVGQIRAYDSGFGLQPTVSWIASEEDIKRACQPASLELCEARLEYRLCHDELMRGYYPDVNRRKCNALKEQFGFAVLP